MPVETPDQPGESATRRPSPPTPKRLVLVATAGFLLVVALIPLDQAIHDAARAIKPYGDLKRELEALQQFGALGSLVITSVLIGLLDPERFRRALDLFLVSGVTVLTVKALKITLGRARPVLGSPHDWHTLFGSATIDNGRSIASWQVGTGGVEQLWSMPSSHTASAVVLAVFLCALYPRLRPFAVGMACIVGLARVWLGAHWPSDVVAGATVSYLVSAPLIHHYAGVRLLDWFWIRFIDRSAEPAYERMVSAEALRDAR